MMTLGVGIIGCGSIGSVIAYAIDRGQAGKTQLLVVYDRVIERALSISQGLSSKPKIAKNFNEFLKCRDLSLVVEAASQEAVKAYAPMILRAGKDLIIMSAGALVDHNLIKEIRCIAEENCRRIYVPSGAIAGLDGVKAATCRAIEKVTLTTRKPIEALRDSPYFREKFGNRIIKEPIIIYEGPALEACKLFPFNVNVAATLSLAGIGPERTLVRIVADPTINCNIHKIEVGGEFGTLEVSVENIPMPSNLRTSFLAALSAIALLRRITDPLQVGT
ncbi:MAG: aspartate dehydrogenase [Candidatus Bathyarchaeia archaeon]